VSKGQIFMSMNPQTLHLLIRFILGEATEKERQKTEQWLRNDVADKQPMQALEQILHESHLELSQWNEDELWEKFTSKAGITLTQTGSPYEIKPRPDEGIAVKPIRVVMQWCFGINRSASQYFFRFAIIALLILGGSLGTAVYFKKLQEKRELAYQSTYQEYCTQKGERCTLLLADGTNIRLNSATKIRFPVVFSKDKREVFLDGEAFFDVAHDETSPFIVHTIDANIRVLGTLFNVTSYAEDSKTQVIVSEGQVAFGGVKQQDEVLLRRNQVSRIINGGLPSTAEVIRTEKYLAWLKNQMIFENASLAEVFKQLSRKFDVEFKVLDSSLLNRHIMATYSNESLSQIIRSLSLSLRFQYTQRGKIVSVYVDRVDE
jgi:ferric-dicitrate binding protein FerR (iron transport regulator)